MKYRMQFASNKNPIINIKTDRLTLTAPDIENADLVLDSVKASADDIYPWLPWATKDITIEDIENYINYFVKCHNSEKPSGLFFDVWDNECNKYLGNVYFGQIEWRNPSFSIGYWLDSRECNKGYMVEAVNALSHVAFKHFKANRVEISTSKNNIRAKRIPEKLNFELEAEFVNHHINYITKEVSNTLVYSCVDEKKLPKLPDLNWHTMNQRDINFPKKDGLTLHDEIITWANESLNVDTFGSEVIVETPWSSVIKINTGAEPIYLKQTPRDLFLEAKITRLLRDKCGLTAIPEVIATNPDYHCFIMNKCGDLTLRDYFSGNLNLDILIQGINVYKTLQKATNNAVNYLIALGVPDWRLDKFPTLYNDLISDGKFLAENGLGLKQQEKLHCFSPQVKELCDRLAGFRIPECLNHSDFHDNNILYDKTAKTTAIIDLGETAINHPFFSMAALINDAKGRYKMTPDSSNFLELKQACYSGWLESEDDLQAAIQIVEQLLPVYLLFAHMRFSNATCPVELGKIPRMNDRVRKALIWFIDNMEAISKKATNFK